MGQYLYTTKGYNGGWSAAATDLRVSAGGGTWNSKNGFWRTATGWRRFYSNISVPDTGNIAFYFPGGSGVADITLGSDGTLVSTATNGGTVNDYWDVAGQPDSGDWEVKATKITDPGVFLSGTYGSWLNLNSNRYWALTGVSGLSPIAQISFELRHIPTTTIVDTFLADLEVSYSGG